MKIRQKTVFFLCVFSSHDPDVGLLRCGDAGSVDGVHPPYSVHLCLLLGHRAYLQTAEIPQDGHECEVQQQPEDLCFVHIQCQAQQTPTGDQGHSRCQPRGTT